MKTINVETINGIVQEKIYAPEEWDYHKYVFSPTTVKHGIRYYEIPCAFDIETTTIDPKEDEARPYAFMYQWQFCMGDDVYMGRTWEQLTNFFDVISYHLQLSNKFRLPVYVHNLSFEFQFMRRFFYITDGFYRDVRKPLKALLNDSIELRDSYALSNMSLAKFCQNTANVTHYKLVDTYDYSKIRTPDTVLTEEELAYCYNDVRGLAECIREYMRTDSLAIIPMTSTGFVRRDFRRHYSKNKRLRQYFKDTRLDPHLYEMCKDAFRGGDTHANLLWGRQTLHGIHSFDIKSSYPACMMMDQFPIGKFFKIAPSTFYNRDMSEFAMLIECRFENLKYSGSCGNPYLPYSRCKAVSKERVIDNGRILRADLVQCVLTDIDLEIMKREYSYTGFYIREVWASKYGPLPQEFKECLMNYFRAKTELDGNPEAYYEYAKSKNRLNSAYGMMVTDVCKPVVEYIHGEFTTRPLDMDDALNKYYKSRNSFLSYQHGVWVTANARRRLRRGLWKVGRDNVYDDTDSIKCRNDHSADFAELNAENETRAQEVGAWAEAPDGSIKIMGTWEEETPPEGYEEFRTLGAKKYIVKSGGKYHSTIAGVSKKAGAEFFNRKGIDAFEIGTVIERSGHLVAYYNDDEIHKITIDGCTFTTASNTALIDDTYTIGVTGEYLGLLENALANRADIE